MWDTGLETIQAEVQEQLVRRHVFWEVQDIIRVNQKIQIPSSFYTWMGGVYVDSAVIAVRRQLDRRPDSVSIARLLAAIKTSPRVLSRERYVRLYEGSGLPEHFAHRDFDRFAGQVGTHVDPAIVRVDLDRLRDTCANITRFASKRVAHVDEQEQVLPTFQDLDKCLDVLEELLKKYLALFRAEAHVRILPVWQYDWKAIFRQPWIPPS